MRVDGLVDEEGNRDQSSSSRKKFADEPPSNWGCELWALPKVDEIEKLARLIPASDKWCPPGASCHLKEPFFTHAENDTYLPR